LIQREMPQNIDAEESVLGAILLDPDTIERVADILPVDAFSVVAHRKIYTVCLELFKTQKPTDLMTVTTYLHDRGMLEEVGGNPKIAQLVYHPISSVNCENYAGLIVEKWMRRRLIQIADKIKELAYEPGDFKEIYDRAEEMLSALDGDREEQGLTPLTETLIETYQEVEDRHANGVSPGYECGLYDLDAMTGGFSRSDLIVVAGRPSMGKTAIAVQIAQAIAQKYTLPVAIFSLEMSKGQLATRILGTEARIESNRLRTGKIQEGEWEKLCSAIGGLSELPIYIDDSSSISVTSIRTRSRRLAKKEGRLGLILIDYLQLMSGDSDDPVIELARMTRGLKMLAKELDVPVMALSQLSRSVESRNDKRPISSDLRQSGAIEQDADVIMMLYRDEYYNPGTNDKGIAEVIITKHRNGPIGTAKLLFDASHTSFRNLARLG